ncbi:substrate-binding domain-containing protein (plasmid) [Thioclava sp. 'Guangxiensis']|uniref:sugar ABC transporter substrate-binding protein n=1 Tax=Thioclava sp. 'Guangxiensis' TaxID=3149044 RepID=UPI0032C4A6FF
MTKPISMIRAGLLGAGLAWSALPAHAEANLAAAEEILSAHSQKPGFEAPGKPFDAKSCMAGKSILTIPTTSSIPFNQGIVESEAQIAKEVGFKHEIWQNQGNPTQWVQGVEYAISNNFTAIDLMGGLIPASLAPQLAEARKKGIRVYASHYMDVTQEKDPNADISLPVSFTDVGKILAAYAVTETQGKANVLVIGSDDILPSQPYWTSIEKTLAELCPDCKATYVNVALADWATRIQTSTQSALLKDPSINFIIPIYDSMSQFVLPALAITGKRGMPIATFNGTPFVLDMIRNGDVKMDVGESLGWIARSSMDTYMRDLCDVGDVPANLYVPFYIFDKNNAAEAGVPATYDAGYGDAQLAGYRKLWGLE